MQNQDFDLATTAAAVPRAASCATAAGTRGESPRTPVHGASR
jgi:hypothetical protein